MSDRINKTTRITRTQGPFPALLACLLVLAVSGCATVPQKYIPSTVGPVESTPSPGPIEVRISAHQDDAFIGDPIHIIVSIRNSGQEPVWVPRTPDVLLTWVYPNGQRDNFLREFSHERHFSEEDAVLLKPGQQMTRSIAVKTYFFPRPGITEFRALVHAGRNTNPGLQPFWHGETASNGFGVMVRSAKKKPPRGSIMTRAITFLPPSS